MYGLKYIYQEAHRLGIAVPMIDKVYHWGRQMAETVNR
jgi:hypothetical protein